MTIARYRARLDEFGLGSEEDADRLRLLGNVVIPLPREREAFVAPIETPRRPALLLPLYLSLGAAHGFDVYTTTRGLARGHTEGNPLVAPVAANPWALTAVKAASAATSIVLAERLWRRHRGAAVAAMVASNILIGVVAARNAANLR